MMEADQPKHMSDMPMYPSNDLITLDPSQMQSLNEGVAPEVGIQHIGFKLHTEEFLLPMTPVREIVMLPTITYVPKSKNVIEGLVALRGEIMPVLNLRRVLGFPKGCASPTTRVIILQSPYGGYGLVCDEITEFVWLQQSDVESIPQNFFSSEYKILSGVAKLGEKVRGILEVEKLIALVEPQIEDSWS